MTTYLFSAFVFSLSSHALIKASLFSISIFANNISEKKKRDGEFLIYIL